MNKFKKFIKVHKDPLSQKKNDIVYKIMCKEYDASLVKQMSKQLETRISEYKNHINWDTSARFIISDYRMQITILIGTTLKYQIKNLFTENI